MNISDLKDSSELAVKYNIPSLVVNNSIIPEAFTHRARVNGRYNIISPIDWPKGENWLTSKFNNVGVDVLEADGFEILLTPNKSETESRNEASSLTSLIRDRISPTAEIRFVLGPYKENDTPPHFSSFTKIPTPSIVRNSTLTKAQSGVYNFDTHSIFVSNINNVIRVPLKISGNVCMRCISSMVGVSKFGVSLSQAKGLIREYQAKG